MKKFGLALFYATICSSANSPTLPHEALSYSVNWPSGLSLGESQLSASASKPAGDKPENLNLNFSIDASIPGFQVLDKYHSQSSSGYCSLEFDKNLVHGRKKVEEKTTFDSDKQTATRETKGGGKTELNTGSCGKDALTYLYFLRRELSQGRLPPTTTVYFGAPYQVRVEFAGTQTIKIGDNSVKADRLTASLKGPASDISFEVFFLKDAARTPALVKVPLTLGTFSMELIREP
ncbi:MAG: DUF3108 domain-containing protein [Acidobacteriaceae bacterium]|nr:DUF3108 domain-containing protein [Acidobacteriaceae bacterium]